MCKVKFKEIELKLEKKYILFSMGSFQGTQRIQGQQELKFKIFSERSNFFLQNFNKSAADFKAEKNRILLKSRCQATSHRWAEKRRSPPQPAETPVIEERGGDVIENVHTSSCAKVSVLRADLDNNVADSQEPPGALKPDQSGQSLRRPLRISNAYTLNKH